MRFFRSRGDGRSVTESSRKTGSSRSSFRRWRRKQKNPMRRPARPLEEDSLGEQLSTKDQFELYIPMQGKNLGSAVSADYAHWNESRRQCTPNLSRPAPSQPTKYNHASGLDHMSSISSLTVSSTDFPSHGKYPNGILHKKNVDSESSFVSKFSCCCLTESKPAEKSLQYASATPSTEYTVEQGMPIYPSSSRKSQKTLTPRVSRKRSLFDPYEDEEREAGTHAKRDRQRKEVRDASSIATGATRSTAWRSIRSKFSSRTNTRKSVHPKRGRSSSKSRRRRARSRSRSKGRVSSLSDFYQQ